MTDVPDLKALLHTALRHQREALLWKVDGLSERDARWPMTPTGTNLLGLLKHVASVEWAYFGLVMGHPMAMDGPWLHGDAEDNADLWATAEESVSSVREFAVAVFAEADATLDALGLDAPGHVPWWGDRGDVTLGQILVHVVAEEARHVGQADITRELTDGAVGLNPRLSNLPPGDADWWGGYVARLRAVAEAAGDPAV